MRTQKDLIIQLHQLRGRVGRGECCYCILITKGILSEDAQTRIKAMVSTNDGFKISEIDLKTIRGPGDLLGTKQSGVIDFKLADLTDDVKIFDLVKKGS